MATKKSEYETYLNSLHTVDKTLELTEHCWAGNDKSSIDKRCAKAYAYRAEYGTILRQFDKTAFEVGYNDWLIENKL